MKPKGNNLFIYFVCVTLFLLLSCRSKTIYVPTEIVKTEYRDKFIHDSIHYYDSIYVKEKGDTFLIEKYKYIYKDKLRTDTVCKTDSVTINVPYAVTRTKEIKVYPGWLVVLACLGCLGIGYTGIKLFNIIKKIFIH